MSLQSFKNVQFKKGTNWNCGPSIMTQIMSLTWDFGFLCKDIRYEILDCKLFYPFHADALYIINGWCLPKPFSVLKFWRISKQHTVWLALLSVNLPQLYADVLASIILTWRSDLDSNQSEAHRLEAGAKHMADQSSRKVNWRYGRNELGKKREEKRKHNMVRVGVVWTVQTKYLLFWK